MSLVTLAASHLPVTFGPVRVFGLRVRRVDGAAMMSSVVRGTGSGRTPRRSRPSACGRASVRVRAGWPVSGTSWRPARRWPGADCRAASRCPCRRPVIPAPGPGTAGQGGPRRTRRCPPLPPGPGLRPAACRSAPRSPVPPRPARRQTTPWPPPPPPGGPTPPNACPPAGSVPHPPDTNCPPPCEPTWSGWWSRHARSAVPARHGMPCGSPSPARTRSPATADGRSPHADASHRRYRSPPCGGAPVRPARPDAPATAAGTAHAHRLADGPPVPRARHPSPAGCPARQSPTPDAPEPAQPTRHPRQTTAQHGSGTQNNRR
jgi:hypothetical protein